MISKTLLKQVMVSNQSDVERYEVMPRALPSADYPKYIFVGVRRAGKSFMLFQKMQQMLASGHGWDEMLYLNFEDDRLEEFTREDFESILECHLELYGKRPMLFLDEIQNVDGWEKFARRLADAQYSAWITGSNAKMLSKEIMSALGGRYLTNEVYPYSFSEVLQARSVPHDELDLLSNEGRALVRREWSEHMAWGGLPEAVGLPVKRNYLSSTFQKIYLGDICNRNKISNPNILRLLIKKLAENVGQPVTYNRLANTLSAVSGKISTPTVSKYIEHAEDAWLLLRLRNTSAPFADKETACKYYFVDNGVLNLFLIQGETALLENIVALSLFRKYGNDENNERVFFFNDKVEVDFYVPEDELAIQATYSIADIATREREVGALTKLPNARPCRRRIILTNDEEETITDAHGQIEVMPVWKWVLSEK